MDRDKDKVGYEINFNRHFYKYTPPRLLEEIECRSEEGGGEDSAAATRGSRVNPVPNKLAPRTPHLWGTTQLRYAGTCLDGRRIPLNVEQRSRRKGDYPYWGANGIVDTIDDCLFDEPLVLVGEDGAPFFDSTRPVAFYVIGKNLGQ